MLTGPKKEIYDRRDFKPHSADFELYRKFQDLLNNSETINILKTKPQYFAVRIDGNISGGSMGGSEAHVGVHSPEHGQPPVFFILYNKGGKYAVQIDNLETLIGAEVLLLDGEGSPKWSDVSAHPKDYDWQKIIKQ